MCLCVHDRVCSLCVFVRVFCVLVCCWKFCGVSFVFVCGFMCVVVLCVLVFG